MFDVCNTWFAGGVTDGGEDIWMGRKAAMSDIGSEEIMTFSLFQNGVSLCLYTRDEDYTLIEMTSGIADGKRLGLNIHLDNESLKKLIKAAKRQLKYRGKLKR